MPEELNKKYNSVGEAQRKLEEMTRNTIDRGEYEPLIFHKYTFKEQAIKYLLDNNFPIKIKKDTIITELHLGDVRLVKSNFDKAMQEISKIECDYVIAVSWASLLLCRFNFNVEKTTKEIIKMFNVSKLIENQERFFYSLRLKQIEMQREFDSLEIEKRTPIFLDRPPTEEEIKALKERLDKLKAQIEGYQKLLNKKGRKLDTEDVYLAWRKNNKTA